MVILTSSIAANYQIIPNIFFSFILSMLYIKGYYNFKQVTATINNRLLKTYFDKLFIIKLTKIVKENLYSSLQSCNVAQELEYYYNLKFVAIYKNNNNCSNFNNLNFILIDGKMTLNFDITNSIRRLLDQYEYTKEYNNTIVTQQDVTFIISPLQFMEQLIGVVVYAKHASAILADDDLETMEAISELLAIKISVTPSK